MEVFIKKTASKKAPFTAISKPVLKQVKGGGGGITAIVQN